MGGLPKDLSLGNSRPLSGNGSIYFGKKFPPKAKDSGSANNKISQAIWRMGDDSAKTREEGTIQEKNDKLCGRKGRKVGKREGGLRRTVDAGESEGTDAKTTGWRNLKSWERRW